jgi:non-specific serine/threonine protein kinase/serine/threonine-protein kinase
VAAELTPERWRRVKDVLGDALELPPERRGEFVASACSGDEDLRRRVEDLIEAEGQSWTLADRAETPPPPPAPAASGSAAGRRIGHYEIVREIGRGGMGAVYLARRHDDFEKRVAIKLVRAGLSDFETLRRFLAERQIAARLEHPSIARLLDGGATAEGEPYFVMEYVEGEPLLDYCDEHRSSIDQRLDLFEQICGAVAFAHRNLVVHRDIKPANVLVTADGAPKLLDFGIARLLDEEGRTAGATDTLFRVMTPDYASPEQIRGAPITTATDVYSLGVVLYELLTGRRPYRLHSGRTDELIRVVCETEPDRPSAAASRARPPEAGEEAGAPPSGETSASLARRLRGDLDAIVSKAMRKEPERRYGSVEQLVEDVRRHREGLPVLARRGTLAYRAGKFVRRHRAGLAAAALVFIALGGGLAATLREARRARAAEARAQRRFDDVRKLANSLLFELDGAIQDLPGSTPARSLVVKRALEYLDVLAREAGGDRALRRELAEAYIRVGDVQGNSFMANLGDVPGAVQSYAKAVALLEPAEAGGTADDAERATLAHAYLTGGGLQLVSGEPARAVAMAEKGLPLVRALAQRHPDDAAKQRELAQAWQFYAFYLNAAGREADSRRALANQAEILRARLSADPGDRAARRSLGQNLYLTGQALRDAGDLAGARQRYDEAAAIGEALREQDPGSVQLRRDLGYLRTAIGGMEDERDDHAAALEQYALALVQFESMAASDSKSVDGRLGVAMTHYNMGLARAAAGDRDGAIRDLEQARKMYEPIVQADPSNAWVEGALGELYLSLGREKERASGRNGGADPCALYVLSNRRLEKLRSAGKLSPIRAKSAAEAAEAARGCGSSAK